MILQEMLLAFSTGMMMKRDKIYEITEWTIVYNDQEGSISFGLFAENQYEKGHRLHKSFRKFYRDVFVNLHCQLGTSARIYFATRSIFGSFFE